MTQEKTLHDLYQLLWEQIKDSVRLHHGLCIYVNNMYMRQEISPDEYKEIISHMKSNLPKEDWLGFSWPRNNQGTEDRKSFVLRMIEETKNN